MVKLKHRSSASILSVRRSSASTPWWFMVLWPSNCGLSWFFRLQITTRGISTSSYIQSLWRGGSKTILSDCVLWRILMAYNSPQLNWGEQLQFKTPWTSLFSLDFSGYSSIKPSWVVACIPRTQNRCLCQLFFSFIDAFGEAGILIQAYLKFSQ